MLDPEFVRNCFPGLDAPWIFMDNAGGSQICRTVTDRIAEFYQTSYVQLGASYAASELATGRVAEGQAAMARFIGAADPAELVMGSSTSLLLRILAWNLGSYFPRGSEIIVTDCDHEANIGCWRELEQKGMVIKTWKLNPETFTLEISDLEKLLTRQTRLVAFTHASNILGTVNPVKEITKRVHQTGALVCVDGVAFAPHRMIDVTDLDADFYVFSFYKTYGPHYAVLYGKKRILLDLPGNNHFFIGKDQTPYKFQPGHVNFEFAWGLTGLCEYYDTLYEHHFSDSEPDFRRRLSSVSRMIEAHENRLASRLLDYLNGNRQVKVIGQRSASDTRVPTVSFIAGERNSAEIVSLVDTYRIGIRFGDFYARRLIDNLGLSAGNGVVRVSMVHYNTLQEVDKLIGAFEHIL